MRLSATRLTFPAGNLLAVRVRLVHKAMTETSSAPTPPAERAAGSCEGGLAPGREDTPEPSTARGRPSGWRRCGGTARHPTRPHLLGDRVATLKEDHHATHPVPLRPGPRRPGVPDRGVDPPPPAAQV